jgi:hypothetical protein
MTAHSATLPLVLLTSNGKILLALFLGFRVFSLLYRIALMMTAAAP